MSANLNGYSDGKEGIHKLEMQKRIKALEDDLDALKHIVYQLLTAIENGANYAIVDQKEYAVNDNYILVNDCLDTLQKLSNYHRKKSKAKIIGLTGSNGKTTSKELILSVLKSGFKTIATIGNLNNHIGVPLTLLSIEPETEIAIIEMGANHLKEIELLCNIADPDYGHITNFGKAHLEGFINLEGVIKGKSELYAYLMKESRLIFINSNDNKQLEITKEYSNKFTFGKTNSNVNYSVNQINPQISISVEDVTIKSNLFGEYNAENLAAAICIGKYFDLSNATIKEGIENYIPNNNRSQIIEKGSNKIILDAYNANPSSLNLAIDELLSMSGGKLFIIGSMKELGNISKKEHELILAKLSDENSVFVGDEFMSIKSEKVNVFESVNDLIKDGFLKNISKTQILIKGSRSIELEKVVDFL